MKKFLNRWRLKLGAAWNVLTCDSHAEFTLHDGCVRFNCSAWECTDTFHQCIVALSYQIENQEADKATTELMKQK